SERLDMSLRPELRPRGSSTCLKAELLGPKGSAERKGKASPLQARRGKYSPGLRKHWSEGTGVFPSQKIFSAAKSDFFRNLLKRTR
ncbi:MAG: hypothetical protein ACETWT_09600, partial [Thermodesulfobacteriota bacterium]